MEPAGVEAFAEGVFPGSPDRGWWRPGGLGSGSRIGEHATPGIGELDATFDSGIEVGVPGDVEPSLVVEAVVSRAEAQQVPGVGGTVCRPVDDVNHFDEPIMTAAGNAAAAIAVFDDSARALGHDVLRAAHRDRTAFLTPDRADQRVARDALGGRCGNRSATSIGRTPVEVEVDVDPEAIASIR